MNAGRIFVSTMTVLSLLGAGVSLSACARNSGDKALKEGNQRAATSDKTTSDLRNQYGIVVDAGASVSKDATAKTANEMNWGGFSAPVLKEIKRLLTAFIANETALLNIEQRKDLQVENDPGRTRRRLTNARLYLESLEAHLARKGGKK